MKLPFFHSARAFLYLHPFCVLTATRRYPTQGYQVSQWRVITEIIYLASWMGHNFGTETIHSLFDRLSQPFVLGTLNLTKTIVSVERESYLCVDEHMHAILQLRFAVGSERRRRSFSTTGCHFLVQDARRGEFCMMLCVYMSRFVRESCRPAAI